MLLVRVLMGVVGVLRDGIAELERTIDQIAISHSDYVIFSSFPGAGRIMTPRLMAAFGSLRDRYRSASEMQSFSGIAPVKEESGSSQWWVHFRRACPKFLRQTFHEYAALSIPHCPWAKEFYQKQKARGKSHHAAIRSLAFKWIRILFRCWQSRTPYDETLYRQAQQTRQADDSTIPDRTSPPQTRHGKPGKAVAPACGSSVELQFKSVAGFQKLTGPAT